MPFLLFQSPLFLLHLPSVVTSSFLPLRFFLCPSCRLFWLVSFGCGFNFSFVCLVSRPLSFRCWLLYFRWFLSLFLWVLLLQLLLSFLLSPRCLFLFGVSFSTIYSSSCVFSGFFYSGFIYCHPFCRLTSSRFFCVICSPLYLHSPIPQLTFHLFKAFLQRCGGGGGDRSLRS